MAYAINVTRRWQKASANLLDPHQPGYRTLETEHRGVNRLLADCLAATLVVDRQTPLRDLLAEAARRGHDVSAWERDALAPRPSTFAESRARVVRLMAVTLAETERMVTDVSTAWDGVWAPSPELAFPTPLVDAATPVAAIALEEGFVHVALVSRLGAEHSLLVVPPDEPPAESVARHVRLLARVPRLPGADTLWAGQRPTLLTRTLWHAAALLDPPPFIAEALASGRYPGWGAPPPGPPRPSEPAWTELIRTRVLHQFRRARARAFRHGKRGDALAREVLHIAPALDRIAGLNARVDAPYVAEDSPE
ncbi:MAG: hypothetical protein ACRENC_18200, partial [Gemmatimonadaceae bacterium]